VQGITLITFPAASTIFTTRGCYDLSSSQFASQVATVIAAAACPSWSRIAGPHQPQCIPGQPARGRSRPPQPRQLASDREGDKLG